VFTIFKRATFQKITPTNIATKEHIVMLLMKIWCFLLINLFAASLGKFLTEMPIMGRKYEVCLAAASSFSLLGQFFSKFM